MDEYYKYNENSQAKLYSDKWECEDGNIWIDAYAFFKSTIALTVVK